MKAEIKNGKLIKPVIIGLNAYVRNQ